MSVDPFPVDLHPDLAALLRDEGWTGFSPTQTAAWAPVRGGGHVLLVAPTGSGKTEAALLPVLSRILEERDALRRRGRAWPTGFKGLYITPLRALNRDLLHRIEDWCARIGITVGVRHGDTSPAQRSAQARRPPDLLITTPETVQLLLYGDTLRRHLATVRFVVVDEVHDLAASERGAQLGVALERIEEVIAQPEALRDVRAQERACPEAPAECPEGFQRIGLSATVADAGGVAQLLAGHRQVEVVRVPTQKTLRLHVTWPRPDDEDEKLAGELALPPAAVAEVRAVRAIVRAHPHTLVFQNTRDGAELLVSRSGALDGRRGDPPLLELHHGSLDAAHRAEVEERFKQGALAGLVATSSMELGIDVGAMDHVVQVHSPRSVARLVQRLGRAGHRIGAVSEGTLLAAGPEDILECLAVATRAVEGRLEPLPRRAAPLVVLANQIVALVNEYKDLHRGWTYRVVTRAGPFLDLDEGLFDAVWDTLLDVETLFAVSRDRIARGGRARRHFLSHVSLIPDEETYRITDEVSKRTIGSVDDASVAAGMDRGAFFVLAGRAWRVLEVDVEARRVRVAPAKELGAAPQWVGSALPVSREVAQEVARLRGRLATTDAAGLAAGVTTDVLAVARAPILAQQAAGLRVPTDKVVTVEADRRAVTVNVALGTRGNDALGRITQALLHQRLGAEVGLESDAYRIHLTLPERLPPQELEGMWRSLDPDSVADVATYLMRDAPVLRQHLVHVAKQFGALPPGLDPNRTTRARLEALLSHPVLEEEALSRLAHDRFDLDAVADFLRDLRAGRVEVVVQGVGPISRLGRETMHRLLAPARTDDALLAATRERVEKTDVLMACTTCGHHWPGVVGALPRKPHCRRCGSHQTACLRPWHTEAVRLLRRDPETLSRDDAKERARMVRNGTLVASFGIPACLLLVGRGIGPDTAARILQRCPDPEQPVFWRELLRAELEFARTRAFWS